MRGKVSEKISDHHEFPGVPMSGPQGPDQTQPWQGQDQPTAGGEQPTSEAPSWQQPPAYSPQQYPQYQQPGQQPYPPPPPYPPTEQFGQQPPADYGQQPYPQYGQQPGQYPQQYGQYAPYTAPGSEQGGKRSTGLILGILAVLGLLILAAVAVVLFVVPGLLVTTKLDVNAAQSGVQQILTDEANGYGAKNVEDVKCNNGQSPTVKKGETFNCEVSIDGTKRQVTVTFQDDDGTYEVGRPK
jgi:hypothetical protein